MTGLDVKSATSGENGAFSGLLSTIWDARKRLLSCGVGQRKIQESLGCGRTPGVWKDVCGVGRLSCVLISRPLFLGSGLPDGGSSDYFREGGHPGSWSDSKWNEMSLAGMETWPYG